VSATLRLSLLMSAMLLFHGCTPDIPSEVASRSTQTGGLRLLVRAPVGTNVSLTRPVTDGARIIGHTNGRLISVDRAAGTPVWQVDVDSQHIFGSPVVHDGRVLSAGTKVWAFSSATGAELWTVALDGRADHHTGAAANGRFYFGTDSTVYALDVATGAQIWRTGIGDTWEFRGRTRGVAVRGDTVYACAQEPLYWNGYRSRGNVVALDANTGAILWRYLMHFETEYNFCFTEPLVTDHHVVVADAGGNNIVALERATGEFLWRFRGDEGWVGPWDTPAAIGDTIVTAAFNDKHVAAFEVATGRSLWRTELGGSVWTAAPCGRVVLAHHFDLAVLDQRDGRVLASEVQRVWNPDDAVYSRFLVEGDTAFVFGRGMMLKLLCPR
jgi:outer membrane protein assembly factor BamB